MPKNIDENQRRALLLLVWWDSEYERIIGVADMSTRRVLTAFNESSNLSPFDLLVEYLDLRNISVYSDLKPWREYVTYVLQSFKDRCMIPRPEHLKNPMLIRKCFGSLPEATSLPSRRVDYSKVLAPSLRGVEFLKLLGLHESVTEI